MATVATSHRIINLSPLSVFTCSPPLPLPLPSSLFSFSGNPKLSLSSNHKTALYSYRFSSDGVGVDCSFKEAVMLFNTRDYYKCHDFLEALWNQSQEPTRTLLHAILQCAVAFHHLFNQNHRGAMIELGEGLCKLRKMNLDSGPFYRFEKEISAVLDFIYHTQLELAACTDDFCLALDQSETSYKLLGGYAAGQHLYCLETDDTGVVYIVFCPDRSFGASEQPPRVKLPTLHASEQHLIEFDYT